MNTKKYIQKYNKKYIQVIIIGQGISIYKYH